MTKHFRHELDELSREILVMGGLAETALGRAVRAFHGRDGKLADAVIEGDREIDAMELRIEEEVLKILALYAPTAKDLRFVVGVFKITNDLERVGDLAVNIAERARDRKGEGERPGTAELEEMTGRVRAMLRGALDAFVAEDRTRAEEVLATDDVVDEALGGIYAREERAVNAGEAGLGAALRFLSTAKYLERIADHATNIAEDVIYLVSGDVVKHGN